MNRYGSIDGWMDGSRGSRGSRGRGGLLRREPWREDAVPRDVPLVHHLDLGLLLVQKHEKVVPEELEALHGVRDGHWNEVDLLLPEDREVLVVLAHALRAHVVLNEGLPLRLRHLLGLIGASLELQLQLVGEEDLLLEHLVLPH